MPLLNPQIVTGELVSTEFPENENFALFGKLNQQNDFHLTDSNVGQFSGRSSDFQVVLLAAPSHYLIW
jgi:hypothetical protein